MITHGLPYLRKLIGCQAGDFTLTSVWIDCSGVVKRIASPVKEKTNVNTVVKHRKARSDAQIDEQAYLYGHLGYEDIPQWLQGELSTLTTLQHNTRPASDLEQWDTVADATEHRITNNEKSTTDILNKYSNKGNQLYV